MIASEFIDDSFGILLFVVGLVLMATGAHFEIVNRVHLQQKYLMVPSIAVILLLIYLILPQFFRLILPRQNIPQVVSFSPGFPVSSNRLTFAIGGGGETAITFTRDKWTMLKSTQLSARRQKFHSKFI